MKTSLQDWTGAKHLSLTLLFTDIVDSTVLGGSLGDDTWIVDLAEHFRIGRMLADQYDHHVVKVIGDAFMIAFRNSVQAVEFAVEFSKNTGRPYIGIRVGIHTGRVEIMDNDIYGLNVNKTARIQSENQKEGILVSDPIKEDFVKARGSSSRRFFRPMESTLRSFGRTPLWTFTDSDLKTVYLETGKARKRIKMEALRNSQPSKS
jgi:class 3 adenylate cyclase